MNLRTLFAITLLLWSIPVFASPTGDDAPTSVVHTDQSEEEKSPEVHPSAAVNTANILNITPAIKTFVLYPMLSIKDLSRLSHASQTERSAYREAVSNGMKVDLSNRRQISEDQFKAFFGKNGLYSQVKNLSLANSMFDSSLLSYLPDSLVELDLRDTSLNGWEIERLAHLTNLRVLNLSSNRLGLAGPVLVSSKLKSLHSLDISHCDIQEMGAEFISRMSLLNILNISGNEIRVNGAQFISNMESLKTLDISWNFIGERGAAEFVSKMTSLNNLNISWNTIGDRGAELISKNLKSLHTLDVSNNEISEDGAEFISSMKLLHTLDISGNRIGERGPQFIRELYLRVHQPDLDLFSLTP